MHLYQSDLKGDNPEHKVLEQYGLRVPFQPFQSFYELTILMPL